MQSSFHFLEIWKAEEYENVSAESINKLDTNQTWHVKWNHCWVTFKSFQRNTYKYHFAAFWRNKSILFLFSQISTWCFLSARQWCIVFLIDTSFPSSDDFNFCWNNCEILFPASKEAIEKYKTVCKYEVHKLLIDRITFARISKMNLFLLDHDTMNNMTT